jgi:hypothetical protein
VRSYRSQPSTLLQIAIGQDGDIAAEVSAETSKILDPLTSSIVATPQHLDQTFLDPPGFYVDGENIYDSDGYDLDIEAIDDVDDIIDGHIEEYCSEEEADLQEDVEYNVLELEPLFDEIVEEENKQQEIIEQAASSLLVSSQSTVNGDEEDTNIEVVATSVNTLVGIIAGSNTTESPAHVIASMATIIAADTPCVAVAAGTISDCSKEKTNGFNTLLSVPRTLRNSSVALVQSSTGLMSRV